MFGRNCHRLENIYSLQAISWKHPKKKTTKKKNKTSLALLQSQSIDLLTVELSSSTSHCFVNYPWHNLHNTNNFRGFTDLHRADSSWELLNPKNNGHRAKRGVNTTNPKSVCDLECVVPDACFLFAQVEPGRDFIYMTFCSGACFRERQCYQCLLMKMRHRNILQYTESKWSSLSVNVACNVVNNKSSQLSLI